VKTLKIQTTDRAGHPVITIDEGNLPDPLKQAKQAMDAQAPDTVRSILSDRVVADLYALADHDPSRVEILFLLGFLFARLGELEKARDAYERALTFGSHALILQQLGRVYRRMGQHRTALRCRRQALTLEPDNTDLWTSYALDLMRAGQTIRGLEALRFVLEKDPDNADVHSKLLFHWHYDPEPDRAALLEAHKSWGRRHAPLCLARRFHTNDPNPERRLRIGYIGADFYRHSAAYNFEAVLEAHHREEVETFGYGNVREPDRVTERFRQKFDHYRDIKGLDNHSVVRLILRDRIDILLFMSGHTGGNCLAAAAYKPAPILIDFGGINTTGVEQVDYRITDHLCDPEGVESLYVEELLRMPHGFICYRPPEFAPEVTPLPMLDTGTITFGSFNNGMKINPMVVALWAQILKDAFGSRLIMKLNGGNDPGVREYFRSQFERHGVDRGRIELYGWLSPVDHLKLYNHIDIGLDTFPFNGCITTLEGLWMGVPTLSLVGSGFVTRAGLTILKRAGLEFLAVTSMQAYRNIAVALAQNRQVLSRIRRGLRPCLANSDLCNADQFAHDLEAHFRRIWQKWCRTTKRLSIDRLPTGSQADVPRPDSLTFFICEDGDLKYTVRREGLPSVAFDTLRALEHGDISAARTFLDEEAVHRIQAVAAESSGREDVYFLLGILFSRLGEDAKAEAWFRRSLEHASHALAYFELGRLSRSKGQISQALEYYQQAVRLSPGSRELWTTWADCLIKAGHGQEGLEILEGVATDKPDRVNDSKYLWHLHQSPELDQQILFEAHRKWGQRYAPSAPVRTRHGNSPDPGRRLRIGYISPDFCGHSVAFFFESLLAEHDARQVETFGYGQVYAPDEVTDRLRSRFDHYMTICSLDDRAVADRIRADGIDILVDLAGHTGDNRLGVLACKPAPVQISYLGYPDTTGMSQVDFRFTDQWADLPSSQRYHTERLWFLDSGFICYRPPGFAPAVGPLPLLQKGHVTFGSFNNNFKINGYVLEIWSRILKAVPQARLLLKFNGGDDPGVQAYYAARFQALGVPSERIQILGRRPVLEHFACYNQVDMALDTYPYHGTTTTCEALWMGVPTVSLIGSHHASRVGLSLLTRVGLEVFTASTAEEYITKAVAFASQRDHLATIRRSARAMMLNSPLCDGKAYARGVEAAYRQMWRQWCRTNMSKACCMSLPSNTRLNPHGDLHESSCP